MERLLWFWVWLATSYCRRLYLVVLTDCTYSILPRTAESLSFSFRCREKLFQLTIHKKADFEGGRKVDYLIFVLTHSPARGWLFSVPIPSQSVRYNTTNNFDTKQTISVTFLKTKKRLNKSIAFLHKQIYNNVFQFTDFHLTINKGCRNIFPHPLLTIVFYSNSTITNQFCLEIICCRVRFSFDFLIYPYYPAYMG